MSDLSHLSVSDHTSDSSANVLKERELLPYGVMFERAKSSRSTCKNCNLKIDAGEMRFGRETFAQFGVKMQWFHPSCAFTLIKSEDNRSKCKICSDKIAIGDTKLLAGCTSAPSSSTKFHYHCFQDHGLPADSFSYLQKLLRDAKTALDANESSEPKPAAKASSAAKSSSGAKSSTAAKISKGASAKGDIFATSSGGGSGGEVKKRKLTNPDLTSANLSMYNASVPSVLNTSIMGSAGPNNSNGHQGMYHRKSSYPQYGLDADAGATSNDEGSAEPVYPSDRAAFGDSKSSNYNM